MKNKKCPCENCIILAMCLTRSRLICDKLMRWYRADYPRQGRRKRLLIEGVYGTNLPKITSEDWGITVEFKYRGIATRRKKCARVKSV